MTVPVRLSENPFVRKLTGLYNSKLVKRGTKEWQRKLRKDSFACNLKKKEEVENFYRRQENCTILPVYKLVNKDNKPYGYLNKTIKQIHKSYMKESGDNISISQFTKMRPKECHIMMSRKFEACICEVCINIEEFCKSLSTLIKRKIDSSDVRHLTLCDNSERSFACIYRVCKRCGVHKLDQLVNGVASTEVTWKQWTNVLIIDENEDKSGENDCENDSKKVVGKKKKKKAFKTETGPARKK